MEKHYAKLRDDLLDQQSTIKKEQDYLQKKIDGLCKDKRELSNKISSINKENKTAKQQIEELITEKNCLNKRLENASKEIKNSIKTKKITLEKLEESLITIETLKKKLEQMSRDKNIIENKFTILESEYKQLEEKLSDNLAIGEIFNRNDYLNEKPEKDLNALSSGDNLHNFYDSVQVGIATLYSLLLLFL